MNPMRLHTLLLTALLSVLGQSAMAANELPYQVVDTRMGFEIRRYPAYVVAETRVAGPFEKVGDERSKVVKA